MKILNLYAGVGGNRKLWGNVEVTAVELDQKIANVYKKIFPNDNVIVTDAHEYLLENFSKFDFIWSSPPCQANSKMIRSGRNQKLRFPDLRLYEEVIFLRSNFKGSWVVENVVPYYAPLIEAYKIGRHLFWSNFEIKSFKAPSFPGFISKQNLQAKIDLQNWLGIYYDEKLYYGKNHCLTQVLRNCVHPETGLHIFNCMLKK